MPTLFRQIRQFTERHPDQIASTFNGQSYSYAALIEAADRLRGSLAARGIKRGDAVAIMLPNCPHFIIAHLAVMGLGAASVPINALQKSREIELQIEDSEAATLISWANLAGETERAAEHSESLRVRIYLGDMIPSGAESLVDLIGSGEIRAELDDLNDDELAAIIYTSGVSGHPRGVELTHANFRSHAYEMGRLLRIRESDRFLSALPFSNITSLTAAVHLPLAHGAEAQVLSRFHPGDFLKHIHEQDTTVFVANPHAYVLMSGFPSVERHDMSKLRYAISCESKLSEETARAVEENLHLTVFEAYGTTETSGMITLNLFPRMLPRGSVGQALGEHEIQIFDDERTPLLARQIGQVAVRGPAIARGYHNRKDKTQQAFSEGWFLTSDHGFLDEQSNLTISAHADELILKGGFPVYCREIEEIVEGLPHVQDVAVVGIPDPVLGEEIKAFVVLKDGAVIGPAEIIEYVKERIAIYKCPKFVKLMKELPKTASGKIIRSQLRAE